MTTLDVVVVDAAFWLVILASLALDVTGVRRRGTYLRWLWAGLLLMSSVTLAWEVAQLRGWPVSRLHTLKTMTLPVGLAGFALAIVGIFVNGRTRRGNGGAAE
jgi:hypothetical protein